MKLSIIIVNYNVKFFLEQCLLSVEKAAQGQQVEIVVVDNNSVDGSVEMVKERFPGIILIENKNNTGFAFANNQGIRESEGEYVLLLNPDTVVEEDTFGKIIRFMDAHPDAGGLGVHMIDGKGNFLPESKRGLPSPDVAFYKIFGLSALFPKSKTFGRYHLGYLDKNKTHEVDVLSGAFMLIRKSVLDKVGLLDESFFMYGEDIDLSYRITKGGYKNYYFPETRIIHYKGESTKKSSINYVIVFYKAMKIFAEKHFSLKNARLFSLLINIAIYLRAAAAIAARFINKLFLPLADVILIYSGIYFIKNYWETSVKAFNYPPEFMLIVVPVYILIWITAVYLSGGYDKPIRISRIFRGLLTGTIVILVIYALLSEEYRFSRALILLGAAWATVITAAFRFLLTIFRLKSFALATDLKKRLVIVAGNEEGQRILSLLQLSGTNTNFIGFVSPNDSDASLPAEYKNFVLGKFSQLSEIAEVFSVNEVIFSARDIASQLIIDEMLLMGKKDIEYKIAPPESMSIIGSNSINQQGELYFIDLSIINNSINRRNKRIFDLFTGILLLITFPFNIWFVKNKGTYFKNIFLVLLGKKSWVGINQLVVPESKKQKLTGKKSVLQPADAFSKQDKEMESFTAERLNLLYAREYKISNDWQIIQKGFHLLGNN